MASIPWVVVARREYAEGARSRWFVFMCLLGPLLFAAIIGFTVWAQLRGAGKTARLVLVDGTREAIGAQVAAKLEAGKLGEGQRFTVELATLARGRQRADAAHRRGGPRRVPRTARGRHERAGSSSTAAPTRLRTSTWPSSSTP